MKSLQSNHCNHCNQIIATKSLNEIIAIKSLQSNHCKEIIAIKSLKVITSTNIFNFKYKSTLSFPWVVCSSQRNNNINEAKEINKVRNINK
jgi:hypothetical protein